MSKSWRIICLLSLVSLPVWANDIYYEAIRLISESFYDTEQVNHAFNPLNVRICSFARDRDPNLPHYYYALDCLLKKLNDPYTKILGPDQTSTARKSIEQGRIYSYGIVLDPIKTRSIMSLIPDSPADQSIIQVGDQITAINNISIELLTDQEINDLVEHPQKQQSLMLHLQRGTFYHYSLTLKSSEIKASSYKSKALGDNIFYLRIENLLDQDIRDEFIDLFLKYKISKAAGLILDLRGNKGGLFRNGIGVADLFLEQGEEIISLENHIRGETELISEEYPIYTGPVVVMVDGNTASAAEIITAALQSKERALVLGEKTFGKGSIQRIVELPDDISLHLTVSQFYTPAGIPISGKGLKPDYVTSDFEEALQRAREYIYNESN